MRDYWPPLSIVFCLSTAPIAESEGSVAKLMRVFGFGCMSKVASAKGVFVLIKAWQWVELSSHVGRSVAEVRSE